MCDRIELSLLQSVRNQMFDFYSLWIWIERNAVISCSEYDWLIGGKWERTLYTLIGMHCKNRNDY